MKIFPPALVFFSLLLSGCRHPARPPHSPAVAAPILAPAPAAPLPPEAAPGVTAAYPPELEEYYVGLIPDPDDPRFAYQPGTLVVERRPARPRLGGDEVQVAPAFHRGPVTTARLADNHPAPTAAEMASLALRSQTLIASLNADNQQLRARLAALPAAASSPPPSARPASTAPPPAAADPPAPGSNELPENLNLIRPNADHVIELDPALFATPAAPGNNPFIQLYQPVVQLRELALVVSAAVPGPRPAAIINDVPYSLHSQFQGLEIVRIDTDTVYLRKDSFLLACPVSDRTLRLRLP